jgi:WD40 repeat protein
MKSVSGRISIVTSFFVLLFAASPVFADLLVNTSAGLLRYNDVTGAFIGTLVPQRVGLFTVGPDGDIYAISDTRTTNVVRYSGSTGASLGVFNSGTPALTPAYDGAPIAMDLTFGPDGNLYVLTWEQGLLPAHFEDSSLLRYNAASGAFMDFFIGPMADPQPQRVLSAPDGNFYVSNYTVGTEQGGVVILDGMTGQRVGYLDTLTTANDWNPRSVAYGPGGDLYVTAGDSIVAFDGATHQYLGVFSDQTGYFDRLAFGPDGNLYAAGGTSPTIYRIDGQTGAVLGPFTSGGPAVPQGDYAFVENQTVIPEPASGLLMLVGSIVCEAVRRARRR